MGGRVTGIFHAVIAVPDLDEALRFYRDLLGLEVTLRWDHDPATLSRLTGYAEPVASAATLAAPDGSEIELAEFRRPEGRPTVEKRWEDAGLSFITLTCDDLEATVARLRHAGTRFVGDIVDYALQDGAIVRVVYCFAPEGTTITLIELPRDRERLAAPGHRGPAPTTEGGNGVHDRAPRGTDAGLGGAAVSWALRLRPGSEWRSVYPSRHCLGRRDIRASRTRSEGEDAWTGDAVID